MKRANWAMTVAGAALLIAAGWITRDWQAADREIRVGTNCQVPVRVLNAADDAPTAAVVFHGLTANKKIMRPLGRMLRNCGLRVYLVDFPGHGDNTESFSYERAEFCAAEVVESLERSGELRPDQTILLGHSMGGGIAIRLADRFPAAATISIGTALVQPEVNPPRTVTPVELPRRMPVNLLVLTGQLDLPPAHQTAKRIVEAAGGVRFSSEDLRLKRAVRHIVLPAATHTSPIFDRQTGPPIEAWIHAALDEQTSFCSHWGWLSIVPFAMGVAGLMLLFVSAASVMLPTADAAHEAAPQEIALPKSMAVWTLSGLFAAVFCWFWIPMRSVVPMYTGDYLASILFVAGFVLLILLRFSSRTVVINWIAVGRAAVLGLLTVLAFGAWIDWQLTDAWLNAPRWWRFAVLVSVLLPYFLAEERALGFPGGPPAPGIRARTRYWQRFGEFLVLRFILWLVMVLGIVALDSGEVLVLLLALYLAVFSVFQRLGMDVVRRRTDSPAAAAIFGAILGAWLIAAVFPIL